MSSNIFGDDDYEQNNKLRLSMLIKDLIVKIAI